MITKYVIFVLVVLLLGCNQDKQYGVIRNMKVDEDLSLEYNKKKGTIVFRTEDDNHRLNYGFRKFYRELIVSDGDTLNLDKTGLYSVVGKMEQERVDIDYLNHEGVLVNYNYNPPSPPYGESETTYLNDAILGSDNVRDGNWVGWNNQDVVVSIEFPDFTSLAGFKFRYRDDLEKDIYPPASYSLYGTTKFKEDILLAQKTIRAKGISITEEEAEIQGSFISLKLVVYHYKRPDNDSWLIMDEIILTK